MNRIVVDFQLPPGTLQVAVIDVPLSRVKKAEDLAILRPFDMRVLQVRPSPAQNAELKRLDELDRKTQSECAHLTCLSFENTFLKDLMRTVSTRKSQASPQTSVTCDFLVTKTLITDRCRHFLSYSGIFLSRLDGAQLCHFLQIVFSKTAIVKR